MKYEDWSPWLYNCDSNFLETINTIPFSPETPFLVRLFENPKSPLYLPGPTFLDTHDAIHVLLGRGLLPQDEAFVIGFCMGASTAANTKHKKIFRFVAGLFYPKKYRLSKNDLIAFDIAFEFGKSLRNKMGNIHLFEFNQHNEKSIKQMREFFDLRPSTLKNIYRLEKKKLPNTKSSKRLPS